MAEFKYTAMDPRGQRRSGMLAASSKEDAKQQLRRMRLNPLNIKAVNLDDPKNGRDGLNKYVFKNEQGKWQLELGSAKPTTKDLIIFAKQLATMIASGVPIVQALGLLAAQQRVPAFGNVIGRIRHAVENGSTLSDALEAYPKIFDNLFISMVRAGEASGHLDSILTKLTVYIEKAAKIKSQVKSAMFYPAMVVVVAIGVISALLVFVVPTFAKQFAESGKELPALTQFVVDLSNQLQSNWYTFLGGIFSLGATARYWVNTETGRDQFDAMLLKAPGFGQLFRKIAVGRFCSTMSTMLTSGVPMLQALSICASASGNRTIEKFINRVRGRVEQGARMSEPLGEGGIFPQMVVAMVEIGESTGALEDMLTKVSEFYEEEVDHAVKALLSMIEPIMMVIIGGMVGTVVIAMYLPIFDLGNLAG